MNAINNATLERIYFQGKRQRKYVGKISEVAQELADMIIEAAVSCELSQGVYWISFTQDDNVIDCEIRQSDYILSISMLSFGASADMWPRNYYKLGKTITEYIVNAIAAKQTPQAPAIEAPAIEAESVPATDSASEIEALRKQLADANARIANDAIYMDKLEGDLEAAKAIIVQAGKDFEVLKAENARMKDAIEIAAEAMQQSIDDKDLVRAWQLQSWVSPLKKAIAQAPTTPQAPKSAVPAAVSVDWNGRGYSTGKYPVLGHSQEKQYYMLNISTDPAKVMPKRVSFADCAV